MDLEITIAEAVKSGVVAYLEDIRGFIPASKLDLSYVEEKDLLGEAPITDEHVQNNRTVREMLGQRGIKPEELPPSEDIKKLERRVKTQEKKIASQSGKLPNSSDVE